MKVPVTAAVVNTTNQSVKVPVNTAVVNTIKKSTSHCSGCKYVKTERESAGYRFYWYSYTAFGTTSITRNQPAINPHTSISLSLNDQSARFHTAVLDRV